MDKQVKSVLVVCTMILVFVLAFIYNAFIDNNEQIDSSIVFDEYNSIPLGNGYAYTIESGEYYNRKYSETGYYLYKSDNGNGPVKIVVALGERSAGGYSLELEDINVSSKGSVSIFFKEITPGYNAIGTDAFTYPNEIITLNKGIKDINVVIYGEGSLRRLN